MGAARRPHRPAARAAEAAALRELDEEVGLTLDAAACSACWTTIRTRSGFVITPVVVWGEGAGTLTPNPDEVKHVYHVPLDDLERPEVPILVIASRRAIGR